MTLKICAECQQEKPEGGCPACPEPAAASEVAKLPAKCDCGAAIMDGDGNVLLVEFSWTKTYKCASCA